MMELIFDVSLFLILIFGVAEQFIFGELMHCVYEWFHGEVIELKNILKGLRVGEEVEDFENIKTKRGKLGIITKVVGYFEFIFFGILVLMMTLFFRESFTEAVFQLLPIMGGWIALKVFGNYHQWSGAVFGRASFYIFLLGSVLNIGIAILSAQAAIHLVTSLLR